MKKYSFNYDYLAKKLDQIIFVKDDGSISYSEIFLMQDIKSILVSAYDFAKEIPESEKQFIVDSAIKNFASIVNKDGKQLKYQIKKSEEEFLKTPFIKYIILTSLSFSYFSKLPIIKYLNGSIHFHSSKPKKYNLSTLSSELLRYSKSIPPYGYVPVTVHVKARTNFEAMEKGLELIDLIRGIWNFSINIRIPARIQWGPRNPINIIRLGPTHTLHYSNGNLATELLWYELNHLEKSCNWDVEHKWSYIQKDFLSIRKILNKIPYKNDLLQIFIRYTRALDTNDYESAYLKLWSILELLTDTAITSGYDKTISRSLFFYKDDILSKEIIEHLRIFRNNIVHLGESRVELDSLLFQIKRFVEDNIRNHIKLAGYFNSRSEFGSFLELSRDKDKLEKEIDFRKKAIRILK